MSWQFLSWAMGPSILEHHAHQLHMQEMLSTRRCRLRALCTRRAHAQQAVASHSRHQSAAGQRVRALHELGLYVCVNAAGQLGVPDETRLHSSPQPQNISLFSFHSMASADILTAGKGTACAELRCTNLGLRCMFASEWTERLCRDACSYMQARLVLPHALLQRPHLVWSLQQCCQPCLTNIISSFTAHAALLAARYWSGWPTGAGHKQ